jgi:hypothetical protein
MINMFTTFPQPDHLKKIGACDEYTFFDREHLGRIHEAGVRPTGLRKKGNIEMNDLPIFVKGELPILNNLSRAGGEK